MHIVGKEYKEEFTMTNQHYKGYVIRPKVYQIGSGHEATGKWLAGEYTIGRDIGSSYTEKQFLHKERFCYNESEAETITLMLAKETIDRELVGF